MKFPLHVNPDFAFSRDILDAEGAFIARASNPEVAQVIVDALTEQHDIPLSECCPPPPEASRAVDIGSIPASDITYRQELIKQALAGRCGNDDYSEKTGLAQSVVYVVDELLRQMAKEEK